MHVDTADFLPISLDDIRQESLKDPEICQVINDISSGNSTHLEFSITNGVLVRGIRTVIPKKFQPAILAELHIGHLGGSKMKNLA